MMDTPRRPGGRRAQLDIHHVVAGATRQRIDADFGPSGLAAVTFMAYDEWAPGGPAVDDIVCVCGGRSFPVHAADGLESTVVTVDAVTSRTTARHQ